MFYSFRHKDKIKKISNRSFFGLINLIIFIGVISYVNVAIPNLDSASEFVVLGRLMLFLEILFT